MNICVVIPTYNESKTIGNIIRQIKKQHLDVLIIDDGSFDSTFQIAKDNGALIIRNAKNEGKGASLIKGFEYALSHNFDAVVAMDGDGQHEPEYIPHFIRVAKESKSAIVVGNRMAKTKNMPYVRFLTNKFMSLLISFVAKQNIPDSQCGFRFIKKEVLENIRLETSKFEIESELLIKAARFGFKIASVSIGTIYSGEKSRINPFVDSFRFIRFIVKEIIVHE